MKDSGRVVDSDRDTVQAAIKFLIQFRKDELARVRDEKKK